MLFLENINLAITSLLSNKMRALLTMLGIIIGIAAVIAILTVGNSLTLYVSQSMQEMGANDIYAMVTNKDTDKEEYSNSGVDGIKFGKLTSSEDMSEEDYINVVKAISEFYTTCNMAHEVYTSALKERFERKTPKEQAKEAIGLYHLLKDNSKSKDNMKLLQIFAKAPREKLDDIISSLTQVETFALKLKDNHSKMLGGVDQIDPLILEGALEKLESLSNTIEEMEV